MLLTMASSFMTLVAKYFLYSSILCVFLIRLSDCVHNNYRDVRCDPCTSASRTRLRKRNRYCLKAEKKGLKSCMKIRNSDHLGRNQLSARRPQISQLSSNQYRIEPHGQSLSVRNETPTYEFGRTAGKEFSSASDNLASTLAFLLLRCGVSSTLSSN